MFQSFQCSVAMSMLEWERNIKNQSIDDALLIACYVALLLINIIYTDWYMAIDIRRFLKE